MSMRPSLRERSRRWQHAFLSNQQLMLGAGGVINLENGAKESRDTLRARIFVENDGGARCNVASTPA